MGVSLQLRGPLRHRQNARRSCHGQQYSRARHPGASRRQKEFLRLRLRGVSSVVHFAASDAQTPIKQPVHEIGRITLQAVSGKAASRLWNEYVARYHYLGYTPMSGSQLRYNVFAGEQLVACISFCACAWKLKDRERFIGWSETQRQKNLQLVINNARFLVLPWIECKGLTTKILLETFVEYERHKETCYKAANWIKVGRTTGRGKKSTSA